MHAMARLLIPQVKTWGYTFSFMFFVLGFRVKFPRLKSGVIRFLLSFLS